MDALELKKVLVNHQHWLNGDVEGYKEMRANLRGADLREANLYGANLYEADLCGANLYGADLREANLYGADLRETRCVPYIPLVCPDFGEFVGYKKASGKIVALKILHDSKRLSATTRKCRCDKAEVLGIYDYKHHLLDIQEIASDRSVDFIYRVGQIVSVNDFDDNRWNECSTGIHFFINFQEAVNY